MWSTPNTSPDNSAGTDKFTVTPRSGRQQNERLTTTDPLPRPASSYLSDLPGEHNSGHGAGTQFHGPPEKINVVAILKEVNNIKWEYAGQKVRKIYDQVLFGKQ